MNTQTAIKEALTGKVWEQGMIDTASITFSPELYAACAANVCGNYNKSWTCPPAVGTLEAQREKILRHKKAFVFTTKGELEDSFDYEGMMAAKEKHTALCGELHKAFPDLAFYGASGCPLCEKCAFPDPCRFPGKAISSVEAAGIDVTALSRAAGIRYHNGPNTITYFSMILFD